MLKNLSEKIGAKFPVICCGYFMVKMAHLGYAFSEFFKPGASQVKCQSLQQKDKKRRKGKAKKYMYVTFSKFLFLSMPKQKCHSGKKGILSCCKLQCNTFLSRLELIWSISSLKISKMSKKCVFGKEL